MVIKKIGSFQKASKINVILAGKKTEEVLFEALGFEFVKVNDSLKISCYDAYEESEDWGGGFLYGYTLAEVKIKLPEAIKDLDEREVLKKLKSDGKFNEEFAKLNMDQPPSIGDDGLIFAVIEDIQYKNKGKNLNFDIDKMFSLIIKHLSE
jgi:hypothetical protein